MIYELSNPSDAITFVADDPKVAFYCTLLLGRGAYDARSESGKSVGAFIFRASTEEVDAFVREKLGSDLDTFSMPRCAEIAACLESFAYGSIADRKDHDAALRCITDPEKLAEFKAYHEDQRRTSMSRIVTAAWERGSLFRRYVSEAACKSVQPVTTP